MISIQLPDGSIKQFEKPVNGFDIAKSIGEGLAKAAVAMSLNGTQTDLSTTVTTDATVTFFTTKTPEGLDVMRHTLAAQVLAKAIKDLYPSAKLAIGPTIEHGFYYDVLFETPINNDDLPKIEQRMHEIVQQGLPVERKEYSRDDALALFKARGETYKMQIINDTPASETRFGIYHQQGTDFIDLCRGPHLPNTKMAGKAFKLTGVAGAYWRGDSNNEMLTRIYGVAFHSKEELQAHLTMLEEAAKRDHRKIGPAMDLFHMQEDCPGQVFWHAGGWQIFLALQNYIRGKLAEYNYQEVNTPQLVDSSLYVKSGHWEKFGTENMFLVKEEDKTFAMKPMNCPCHVQIYNTQLHSYRDLPLRMSEFGTCMRNESTGSRHGIMRVVSMTQDDAHIFCTTEQIEQETIDLCNLIREVYHDFGFKDISVKFSDRPEQRVGDDSVWDMAEAALKSACEKSGFGWTLNKGEGAFYGPKLEFTLTDCIGRPWQCGTVQLDFNLPRRLGATFVDANNERQVPVMIHRALLGSFERFIGILIENYAGHFPLWLAPVQVVATGITDKHNVAAEAAVAKLKAVGVRAVADVRNEKVSYKVREHSHKKVPVIVVLGDKEIAENTVTVRRLGSQKQTVMPWDVFVAELQQEIANKALPEAADDSTAAA